MLHKLLRFKTIGFTLASIIGLCYMWDPLYFMFSIMAYFFLGIIGHFIGLHRYYSHSQFECSKPMEGFIWLCSFMSGMGEPIGYTQRHGRHHIYSDTVKDHLHPKTHPFMTWAGQGLMFSEYVDTDKLPVASRLTNSKFYTFVNKHYIKLYYVFLTSALIIDFKLAFYVLIVGGAISSHAGHAVSILCHNFGYRNFDIKDYSTNLTIVNWLTLGTGLHNNHHAVPYAYTNKFKESEQDISAWIIKNVLATKVVEPRQDIIDKFNK